MKLVVLGAEGQAGTALQGVAAAHGVEVVALGRRAFDLTDLTGAADRLATYKPNWLVNFAAFHVLDACEDDFGSAMAINAVAVRGLAMATHRLNCRFLTVSTDYVFDGACGEGFGETDEARPLQAYGVSKRAGELAALAAAPDHTYIVRTCGLYGHSGSKERGGNFIEKRLAEAASRASMDVGSDLVCTPTSAEAFAAGCLALMRAPGALPGIYHLTAEGRCSWAEFTAHGLALAGAACTVNAVDRHGDYGRIRRPPCSVLRNQRARALGIVLPHWRDDLARYMVARRPH